MTADFNPAGGAEAADARRAVRNFRLGVLNGALYQAGEGFMDSNTVIPLFVSRLTVSNALVGLASALGDLGWLLPHPCGSQLNLARALDSAPHRLVKRAEQLAG